MVHVVFYIIYYYNQITFINLYLNPSNTFLSRFVIDIDECATNQHQCNQDCTNNDGSYTCSCVDGFRLDADGYTCNGG